MASTRDVRTSGRTRKPPDDRRADIALAARAVAMESGLSALTLRSVASRAGVTASLIVHYGWKMDDLVAATFASIVSDELNELRCRVSPDRSSAARLGALLETLLDPMRNPVTVIWVQAWALGSRNEPLAASVREQMDAWQNHVAAMISEGISESEFATQDPVASAGQLLAFIDGLNAHSVVRWTEVSDRTALVDRLLSALGHADGQWLRSGDRR